ncbi:hypothetical protein D3C75_798850 [compost metagenome]
MRQMLPDFLRNKRHKRMDQAHRAVEYISKYGLCLRFGCGIRSVKRQLRELDIPVTQIVPNEVVQLAAGLAELVRVN